MLSTNVKLDLGRRFLFWWFALAVLVLGASNFAWAAEPTCVPVDRPLWVVSSRCASLSCCQDQAERIRCWRRIPCRGWQAESIDTFFAEGDPSITTVFYVHGASVSSSDAFCRAIQIHRRMTCLAGPNQRFRMVMFSWPGDRAHWMFRRDLRIKATRADIYGYYLAWLIDRLDPDVPVSAFGFSYGDRTIASALHLLAGGRMMGHTYGPRVHEDRRPVNAVMFAAGMNSYSLAPGQRYGLALSQAGRVLITNNCRDYALQWYPMLWCCNGPPALGFTGVKGWRCMAAYADKIDQMDVTCMIGCRHGYEHYTCSTSMMIRAMPYLVEP